MKTIILAIVLALTVLSFSLRAQNAGGDSPPPPPEGQQPPPPPPGGPRGGPLPMLTKALNLTPDQQTQVKAIVTDTQAKMKALHDASDAKIRELLTPEQQTKFDQLKKQHEHGPGGPGGGEGQPNGQRPPND